LSNCCCDFLCIPQYSFYLIHKQAFVTRHFHWSDPWSSQTIIIVSLNLLRIHYTSFHQISPSSWGQPFRFLTQVSFSKRSLTLQLRNKANSPRLLNEWTRCAGRQFSKHSRCEWTGAAVLKILVFFSFCGHVPF
jgi:hypothetical protein